MKNRIIEEFVVLFVMMKIISSKVFHCALHLLHFPIATFAVLRTFGGANNREKLLITNRVLLLFLLPHSGFD